MTTHIFTFSLVAFMWIAIFWLYMHGTRLSNLHAMINHLTAASARLRKDLADMHLVVSVLQREAATLRDALAALDKEAP